MKQKSITVRWPLNGLLLKCNLLGMCFSHGRFFVLNLFFYNLGIKLVTIYMPKVSMPKVSNQDEFTIMNINAIDYCFKNNILILSVSKLPHNYVCKSSQTGNYDPRKG